MPDGHHHRYGEGDLTFGHSMRSWVSKAKPGALGMTWLLARDERRCWDCQTAGSPAFGHSRAASHRDYLTARRRLYGSGSPTTRSVTVVTAEPAIVNLMVQHSSTIDRAFAALGDPTRRAVLERLGAGSATISELAEPFGMSLTGMKKHVQLLEEAELVTTEKVGRVRRCMLAPYAFEGISTWLQRLDRFAQVVERTKGAR
jgi:DNA-binding transcriptional ArsR family regulator